MESKTQQRLTWENSAQFSKVCEAVRANHSVLVIGEAGMGVGEMAQALYEQMLGDFQAAIANQLPVTSYQLSVTNTSDN